MEQVTENGSGRFDAPAADLTQGWWGFYQDHLLLEDSICDKLVDAWLDRLSEHHELHDKIEFDVAVTALTFAFEKVFQQRLSDVLTSCEKGVFRGALHNLQITL